MVLTTSIDVPAHSYQLSFESSTDWSQFYASAPEILQYWKRVAEKYRLRSLMKFGMRCVKAFWNDDTSKWHVQFENEDTGERSEDIGDVLMTGAGMLNSWKWPDIKGLHDFEGSLLHSADWDTKFDTKVNTSFSSSFNDPLANYFDRTSLWLSSDLEVVGFKSSPLYFQKQNQLIIMYEEKHGWPSHLAATK